MIKSENRLRDQTHIMSTFAGQRAIMFADVSGSSALYKQLGNREAKQQVDQAISQMQAITQSHMGHKVKTIGDELLARFDSAEQACAAAIDIQRYYACTSKPLAIRIGMSFGDTLLEAGDVFGDTVNDAAFVAHIARGQQIVVTDSFYKALPTILKHDCQEFDRIAIKGSSQRTMIFRVHWEHKHQDHSATTVMSIHEITQQLNEHVITLTRKNATQDDQPLHISADQTPFIIGRDKNKSHCHIDSALASRDHCHILFQRGKFVLMDHSTNGTYVCPDQQKEIYLRREALPLQGSGSISIGQPGKDNRDTLLHYDNQS